MSAGKTKPNEAQFYVGDDRERARQFSELKDDQKKHYIRYFEY
jgi:hypothetical protein